VLEVNPRTTTSFVGLAAGAPASLVRAMLDVAEGRALDDRLPDHACTFTVVDAPVQPSP